MHQRYKPNEIHRIFDIVRPVSIHSSVLGEKKSYAQRVLDSGAKEVVALHELDQNAAKELAQHKVVVHNLHVPPSRSFAPEGKQNLAVAAMLLRRNLRENIPTALTCTYGNHRTGRALYLMFRLMRAGHDDAEVYANAPEASAEQLREFYEKEMRPNLKAYRRLVVQAGHS